MKKYNCVILFACLLMACTNKETGKSKTDLSVVSDSSLALAVKQYTLMDKNVADTLFPRSTNPDGSLWTNASGWWTSGFFPGSLWYLYEYSGDPAMKEKAKARTAALEKEKYNTNDHDIGFKMYCSYGNELRLTGDTAAINVLLTSAQSLVTRFDPVVGCIRSWGNKDDHEKPYLVIIDNMMNLELLFWATKQSGDSTFFNVAVAHADNTLKNHFRDDGSSVHVLEYDPKDGHVLKKRTAQGYSDSSAWSRGQAWGLYGYTMAYRETGYQRYLDQAKKIAAFILNHPNLPEDKIPYWDFNAPDIPNALRDASAGAVIASALLELSTMCDEASNKQYRTAAEQMLISLSSEPYRSTLGENNNFLIQHCVGNIPAHSEIDVPLSYADYYYIEGLMRYRGMK